MIYLGYSDEEKRAAIAGYRATQDIDRVVIISADAFPLTVPEGDLVCYSDVIMYVTFYRLLQEITPRTLIVLNECLRTQNRYDLAYNCIRNYLNLTTYQLIFQRLPLIDTIEDFMILFDFDTRSRWKRQPFDPTLVHSETQVQIQPQLPAFIPAAVPTRPETQERYVRERERLFRELGNKDPHTLPRNLYLLGGPDKLAYIDQCALEGKEGLYLARNKRLNRPNILTYAEVVAGEEYTVVDLSHRFIDFADFLYRTGQRRVPVLTADLKVDEWYFQRYAAWAERIADAYASL